jgi:hypothetical protein
MMFTHIHKHIQNIHITIYPTLYFMAVMAQEPSPKSHSTPLTVHCLRFPHTIFEAGDDNNDEVDTDEDDKMLLLPKDYQDFIILFVRQLQKSDSVKYESLYPEMLANCLLFFALPLLLLSLDLN